MKRSAKFVKSFKVSTAVIVNEN